MLWIAVIAGAIVLVTGLVVKYGLSYAGVSDMSGRPYEITIKEYALVAVLTLAIVIPMVLWVGKALSVNNLLQYKEWWNGTETVAEPHVEECQGGHSGSDESAGRTNCDYAYVSGHYTWTETYYVTVCTGSGSNQSCSQEPRYRDVTSPIYTPYLDHEMTYTIENSLGSTYEFPRAYADGQDPELYSGSDRGLPGDIPIGPPERWLRTQAAIEAGNPLPVTELRTYDNPILASQDELTIPYDNGDVAEFKDDGLLPAHTANIMGTPERTTSDGGPAWYADKMSFVDVEAPEGEWQNAVMQFNAALGHATDSESGKLYEGDLHVVAIDSSELPETEATSYVSALRAYWSNPEEFGRKAIAKNAIILVLGTDGQTVTWARAATGMPRGNETMIQAVQDQMYDVPFTPAKALGAPVTEVNSDGDSIVTHPNPEGAFERIALDEFPFQRVCMICEDGEGIGYEDLVDKIEPTGAQKTWMVVVVFLVSGALWAAVALLQVGRSKNA